MFIRGSSVLSVHRKHLREYGYRAGELSRDCHRVQGAQDGLLVSKGVIQGQPLKAHLDGIHKAEACDYGCPAECKGSKEEEAAAGGAQIGLRGGLPHVCNLEKCSIKA